MSRSLLFSLVMIAACGGSNSNVDAKLNSDASPGAPDAAIDGSSSTADARPDATPAPDAMPAPDAHVSSVEPVTCPASGAVDVVASSFMFDKASYAVAVDGIVRFTVTSDTHTMTSSAGSPETFDTNALSDGSQPVCLKFTVAGSYPFHCMFHPSMTGTIVVQ